MSLDLELGACLCITEALQLGDSNASTAEPAPLVATEAAVAAADEKSDHSKLNAQLLNVIGRSVDDVMGASIDLADSLVSALISSLYVGVAIYGGTVCHFNALPTASRARVLNFIFLSFCFSSLHV